MMQHAASGTGERQATDLNAFLEEDVNLAYHGKRAQTPGFTCKDGRTVVAGDAAGRCIFFA